MIPRLTTLGRYFASREFISTRCACRPSPAERLRQRRKARAAVMRWNRAKNMADRILADKDLRENTMTYLNHIYTSKQISSIDQDVPDWRGPPGSLPQSLIP